MAKPTQSGQLYRTVGVMAMLIIGAAILVPTASEAIIGSAETSEAQTEAAAAPYKESAPAPVPVATAPARAPVEFGAPTLSTDPIDLANYKPQAAAPTPPQPNNPYAGEDSISTVSTPDSATAISQLAHPASTNNAPIPPELAALPRPGPKVGTVIGRRTVPDQGIRQNMGPSRTLRFE